MILVKIYSTKSSCNTKVAGLGEIYFLSSENLHVHSMIRCVHVALVYQCLATKILMTTVRQSDEKDHKQCIAYTQMMPCNYNACVRKWCVCVCVCVWEMVWCEWMGAWYYKMNMCYMIVMLVLHILQNSKAARRIAKLFW